MSITFGSLFAGIGGIDLGLDRAGMRCKWQVEINAAARSVLSRHWPDIPKHADIRDCGAHNLTQVDLICGGFPCQDLSVAGKRAGLGGARSGLFYEMTRIADELRPDYILWENVPGLLSSNGGRDFAAVLMELERIGYCGGWTTLDAQFFGVAQRRQRVFGLFARRDIGAARPAEILSLAARLPWNTETRRKARQAVATGAGTSFKRRGGFGWTESAGITAALEAEGGSHQGGPERVPLVAGAVTAIPVGYSTSGRGWWRDGIGPLPARSHKDAENGLVLSIAENQRGELRLADISAQLTSGGKPGQGYPAVFASGGRTHSRQIGGSFGARRLTPRECERLQGFPDDWTAGQTNSARYRQLGNAVCVNVAEWIGNRIVAYEDQL